MAIRISKWWFDEALVRVAFEDTRHPNWWAVFSVYPLGASGPESADDQPDLFSSEENPAYTRTRCIGVEFRLADTAQVDPMTPDAEIRPSWVARFPIQRCAFEARRFARDFGHGENPPELPPLPRGYPNRDPDWYLELLTAVRAWEAAMETSTMEVYREVAKRKRVPVNRVKQWTWKARRLEADDRERGTA